jgi:hypothetical protein
METAEERLAKWEKVAAKQKVQEELDDLLLQNQTLDALIKGLTGDIEIFKNDTEGKWTPADIVRFTMQLNIMKSKKERNLESIGAIIKKQKEVN